MSWPELKPCPFCGSPAEYLQVDAEWGQRPGRVFVRCSDVKACFAITGGSDTEKWTPDRGHFGVGAQARAEQAAAWNRRADSRQTPPA